MARKLGYLVPEFPGQTHAFFWRELRAIEEMGHPVRIYSTRRPGSGACPHAFADEAISRTRYLFPPSFGAIAELSIRPRRLWKALAYVRELSGIGLRDRAKVLALLPSASELARDAVGTASTMCISIPARMRPIWGHWPSSWATCRSA